MKHSMNALHSITLAHVLSGFGVGVLVGMTGVGGGSLMTPILVLLFGIHPATAVGTDLFFAAATKSVGTLVHGLGRTVRWDIVGRLACGSVPATALTLFVLSHFDMQDAALDQLITKVLACSLLFTALTLIFRQQLLNLYAARVGELGPRATAVCTVAVGVFLGAVVSASSIGAGAIGVTALLLLYPRLPTVQIVGSDIAHAVPLTLLAGLGHWIIGSVDTHLLGLLLTGSLPGIVLGSYCAAHVPDRVLRFALAITLLVVGGRLVL